jgi:hypothetical protein
LRVPLNDGLMVPASLPLTDWFMEHMRSKTVMVDTFEDPASEHDLVEATIAFVNGATLEGHSRAMESTFDMDELSEADTAIAESSLKTWRKQLRVFRDAGLIKSDETLLTTGGIQSRYRAVYRDLFSAFIRDPLEASRHLSKVGLLSKLPVETYWQPTANGMAIVHHYRLGNFDDVITVGKALLLDQTKAFAHKLCQCQLGTCGKFFLEKKRATGRPARRYCSKKHMEKAHDLNAAERMKKYRGVPTRKK